MRKLLYKPSFALFALLLSSWTRFAHGLAMTMTTMMVWTAVPPSSNPKSKLNKDFMEQIEQLVEWKNIENGRVWFQISQDNIPKLTALNARSIRLVFHQLQNLDLINQTKEDPRLEILQSFRNNPENFDQCLNTWIRAGNTILEEESVQKQQQHQQSTTTFSISCQKWESFQFQDWSTTDLCNEVAQELTTQFHWKKVSKSENPTFKFNILLHESIFLLELTTFTRPITMQVDELPKPGFKRVESFLVAKTANIQPNEIVLDPMCGCATFLVEGATLWPNAHYIGVDLSLSQLENAMENCRVAQVSVNLIQGDARHLNADRLLIKDSLVDKIISCPPFGRQFAMAENLFEQLLMEWSRILKPTTGKMVLLIDTDNLDRLVSAIVASGCQVEFIRTPFRLGKIKATVLVVSKRNGENIILEPKRGDFDWEKGDRKGRALWAQMRASALGSLVPYSLARTKNKK